MSLEKSKLANHIEALLFLSGEPLVVSRLAKILGKKETEVKDGINQLKQNLEGRGICLIGKDNTVMLGSSPEASKYCELLTKEELNRQIGQAGLETLAIILYKEGAARNEIDVIRGVNSTFTLRNLLIRGLIERKQNPKNKRTYIYTPSIQLLQHLGITKIEELPEFEKFKSQLKNVI